RIGALVLAGRPDDDGVAFGSPRAVPSMAGATEVMAAVGRAPGVRYWASVPNVRGAEMAVAAKVDGLSVTVSASAAYNEKNVHMSIDESVDAVDGIAKVADGALPNDSV